MPKPSASSEMSLREACIQEALRIIEADGVEHLSLREVSRRLGISHQAPYKHFASRDHILAEILKRLFAEFAAHLDRRPRDQGPHAELRAMGHLYQAYALAHPLHYRLMFGTPLPPAVDHPAMLAQAQHAFAILRETITAMKVGPDPDADALFVWSTLHGLASLTQGDVVARLQLLPAQHDDWFTAVLDRIGNGLANHSGSFPGR